MILARYLTPAETGIYSVALGVANMARMLRDFGVTDYLIQKPELDIEHYRSAFTVSLLGALLVAASLYLVAPFAAEFYQEQGVNRVLAVLALSVAIVPIGQPALAIMRRELAYGSLYIIRTLGTLTGSITATVMVINGFSYMSLAWSSLASVAITCILASAFRPKLAVFKPGLRKWKTVTSFGSRIVVIDVAGQLGANADSLVIGKMLGFGPAGLFSRGEGLLRQFNDKFYGAIRSVAYPAFAQYFREGRDTTQLFGKSIAYVTGIAWPFYAFTAIMAEPIILAAFGPQWVAAIPILRILTIAASIACLGQFVGQLLTASGHINSHFRIQMTVIFLRILFFIIGGFYSIEAVAAGQVAVSIIGLTLKYSQMSKYLDIRPSNILAGTVSSAGTAALTAIIPALVFILSNSGMIPGPWIELTAGTAGAAMGWFAGLYLFKHPLQEELTSILARIRDYRIRKLSRQT